MCIPVYQQPPIRDIRCFLHPPGEKKRLGSFMFLLEHLIRDKESMKKIDEFVITLVNEDKKIKFISKFEYKEELSRIIYNEKNDTHDCWERIQISFCIDDGKKAPSEIFSDAQKIITENISRIFEIEIKGPIYPPLLK